MSNQNNPGMSRFAGVIKEIAKRTNDPALTIDYGVIQPDKSLLTHTYPIPIPQSDYLVCRHLKEYKQNTNGKSVGDHGSHTHEVVITQPLKVGDNVLVCWVQNDPVVIDVILSADDVL